MHTLKIQTTIFVSYLCVCFYYDVFLYLVGMHPLLLDLALVNKLQTPSSDKIKADKSSDKSFSLDFFHSNIIFCHIPISHNTEEHWRTVTTCECLCCTLFNVVFFKREWGNNKRLLGWTSSNCDPVQWNLPLHCSLCLSIVPVMRTQVCSLIDNAHSHFK